MNDETKPEAAKVEPDEVAVDVSVTRDGKTISVSVVHLKGALGETEFSELVGMIGAVVMPQLPPDNEGLPADFGANTFGGPVR